MEISGLAIFLIVIAFTLGLFLNGGWVRKRARAVIIKQRGPDGIVRIENLSAFIGQAEYPIYAGPYRAFICGPAGNKKIVLQLPE